MTVGGEEAAVSTELVAVSDGASPVHRRLQILHQSFGAHLFSGSPRSPRPRHLPAILPSCPAQLLLGSKVTVGRSPPPCTKGV